MHIQVYIFDLFLIKLTKFSREMRELINIVWNHTNGCKTKVAEDNTKITLILYLKYCNHYSTKYTIYIYLFVSSLIKLEIIFTHLSSPRRVSSLTPHFLYLSTLSLSLWECRRQQSANTSDSDELGTKPSATAPPTMIRRWPTSSPQSPNPLASVTRQCPPSCSSPLPPTSPQRRNSSVSLKLRPLGEWTAPQQQLTRFLSPPRFAPPQIGTTRRRRRRRGTRRRRREATRMVRFGSWASLETSMAAAAASRFRMFGAVRD